MEFTKGKLLKARNGQTTDQYDGQGRPVWGVDEQGRPVCYAPKNAAGDLDMSVVRCANGRGARHGGKARSGADHGNAKPGLKFAKITKTLPKGLKRSVNAFLETTDLLSLDYNIALAYGRLEQLQGGLKGGNANARLGRIGKAWEDYTRAEATGDPARKQKARHALEAAILEGIADKEQWDLIDKTGEHIRKLVDTEVKRRAQTEATIPIAVLRDYTMRIGGIYVNALIKHLALSAERTTDRIKVRLQARKIDPDLMSVIMAEIGAEVTDGYAEAERKIRRESGDGVKTLWGFGNIELTPEMLTEPDAALLPGSIDRPVIETSAQEVLEEG